MEQAACRDMAPSDGETEPDIFFPERGQTVLGNKAIMTCFTCPVRVECKEYRKRTDTEYGIWAGEWSRRGDADD